MTESSVPVLRIGDWVHNGGGEHQVVAFAGTAVRLRSTSGDEAVVLASYLMGSSGFGLVDGRSSPQIEPLGLLHGLPEKVRRAAQERERHVVEVVTGLPPGAEPGSVPRPEYGPVGAHAGRAGPGQGT